MSALQAFTRGILCNWLVCLAVWQANAAQTLGGKFIVSCTQVVDKITASKLAMR